MKSKKDMEIGEKQYYQNGDKFLVFEVTNKMILDGGIIAVTGTRGEVTEKEFKTVKEKEKKVK